MEGIVVVVCRIVFVCLFGKLAQHGCAHLFVLLERDGWRREERALVAVCHHDNRHVVVFALFVEAVLVIGDDVAVNARPESVEAQVAFR